MRVTNHYRQRLRALRCPRFEKQKFNKARKQNRNTEAEHLHASVGIAKPMLAVRGG